MAIRARRPECSGSLGTRCATVYPKWAWKTARRMRANPPQGRHPGGADDRFLSSAWPDLGADHKLRWSTHRVLRNEANRSLAVAARLRLGGLTCGRHDEP